MWARGTLCRDDRHADAGRDSIHQRRLAEGGEVRGQRKNGSEVPIQVSRSAIPLEGGGGALVTLVDIPEHKKAEERFFQVIEGAPSGGVVVGEGRGMS